MTDAVTEYLRRTARQAAQTNEITHVSSGTWVPTFGGFSADPTGGIYRYTLVGKTCTAFVRMVNAGTSNAANFTVSAPFTAATITNMIWFSTTWFTDNGSGSATPGQVNIGSNTAVFNLSRDGNALSWTASGTKRAQFTIVYEIA